MTALPLYKRPKTRGECADAPRPCPFVSCRYHLLLQVDPAGRIWTTRGEDPTTLAESCALDVADRGPHDAGHVGKLLGHTDSARVYEAEVSARKAFTAFGMREHLPDGRTERVTKKAPVNHAALIGGRFGLLVALAVVPKDEKGRMRLLCRCDCGVEREMDLYNVNLGLTKSCGCRGRIPKAEAAE